MTEAPSKALHYVSCLIWCGGPLIEVYRFDDGTPCLAFEHDGYGDEGDYVILYTIYPTTEEILDAMSAGLLTEREVLLGSSEVVWKVQRRTSGGVDTLENWRPIRVEELEEDELCDESVLLNFPWRRE